MFHLPFSGHVSAKVCEIVLVFCCFFYIIQTLKKSIKNYLYVSYTHSITGITNFAS